MNDFSEIDFDPFSEDYAEHTSATNHRLRECRVARSAHYGGFWSVARHADVVEAFKHDGKELSARHETLDDGLALGGVLLPPSPAHLGFMEHDPPLHAAVRRLMNPWFTAEAAASRRPRIASLSSALLDAHIESGTVDALKDLIEPLATVTTFELLGLPLDGVARYSLLAQQHAGYDAEQALSAPDDAFEVVKVEIARDIDARRQRGAAGAGLIGSLLEQTIDGEPIPDHLLVDSMFLFVIAGADTVGGAFSGADAATWSTSTCSRPTMTNAGSRTPSGSSSIVIRPHMSASVWASTIASARSWHASCGW